MGSNIDGPDPCGLTRARGFAVRGWAPVIFISHSSVNHALAHALAVRLETERYAHFLDLADLHGGDRWETRLDEALDEARALVLCATPAALDSEWVRREVKHALGRGIPVVPCELERCEERWPRELQWIDFTRDPEGGYRRLFDALERIPSLGRTWPRDESPYPGLGVFEARHASVFFGREQDLAAAVSGLAGGAAGRVRTFAGPSGVGKSSFVRAALLPRLAAGSDEFELLEIAPPMRPRTNPRRALATALHAVAPAKGGVRALEAELAEPNGLHYAVLDRVGAERTLVLLVDQLEETLSAASDERSRFVARLQEAVVASDSRLLLLLTLRSDFLTACLEISALAELLRDRLHPLGVLDRAALRRAIVGPAAQAGVKIDAAFVEEVLDDAVDGRALPLLSDALARRWPDLVGGDAQAYAEAYRDAGRVAGGIADRADHVYDGLDPETRSSLHTAMLALAEADDRGRIRRRRAPKQDLPAAAHEALETLVAPARLLIASEEDGVDYLEVAHEALFTSWPLYKRWLDDAEEDLRLTHRLRQDATEWSSRGESDAYLWTGARLAAAETLLESASFAADETTRRFFAASVANDRRMQQREANLIAARIEAEHRRAPVASLLAAAAAVEHHGPTPQLEHAVRGALDDFPEISVCRPEVGPFVARLDPAGRRVVTGSWGSEQGGFVCIFDADTGEELHRIAAHERAVVSLSIDCAGERILSGSRDATVKIWRLAEGEFLTELPGHTAVIADSTFDARGEIVATASRDMTARVFDAATGECRFVFEHPDQVHTVDIDPTGRRLLTSCQDKKARVFSLEADHPGPRELQTVEVPGAARWHPTFPYFAVAGGTQGLQLERAVGEEEEPGPAEGLRVEAVAPEWAFDAPQLPPTLGRTGVADVRFDDRGERLLALSYDATVKVYDLRSGEMLSELIGHEGDVATALFTPGGAQVLTAARDGVARIYDTVSGTLIREFRGHAEALENASLDAAGERFVTASEDDTARVYRVRPTARGEVLAEHGAHCRSLAIAPGGSPVAATTEDGCLLVVHLEDPPRAATYQLHEKQVLGVDISPDGLRAVTRPQYEVSKVVDLRTGEVVFTGVGEKLDREAYFLPDGDLVIADWNGRARLFDTEGRVRQEIVLSEGPTSMVAIHPDGERIAFLSLNRTLDLFTRDGRPLASRKYGNVNQGNRLAFRPDGTQIALQIMGEVLLLDAETLDIRHRLELERSPPCSLRYTRDGRHILFGSAGRPGRAVVFDTDSGDEVLRIPHSEGVTDAAYSPDDRRIVTSGDDRSVRVFDAPTGVPLWQAFEHRGRITRVAFGHDGSSLFTTSTDGTIRRFELRSLDSLIEEVRRLAGRELTEDELESYGLAAGD